MNKSLEFVNKRLMEQRGEIISKEDGEVSIIPFPKFFGGDSADFRLVQT